MRLRLAETAARGSLLGMSLLLLPGSFLRGAPVWQKALNVEALATPYRPFPVARKYEGYGDGEVMGSDGKDADDAEDRSPSNAFSEICGA